MKYIFKIIITISLITNHQSLVTAQVGNMLYGTNAGNSITSSAHYNTFFGVSTGYLNTNGDRNFSLGYQANYTMYSGLENTHIGSQSGYSHNSTDVTIIGYQAGYNIYLSSGPDNTFIGTSAGYTCTTCDASVFIGNEAGYSTTTGDDNVFIGKQAGRTNTTGYSNAFYGALAGYENTTGHHNTFVGDSTGYDNSTGNYNTFIGAGAGASNEKAHFNTFVGPYAGLANNADNGSGSHRNTYFGMSTGKTNQTGSDNTGVGAFADFNGTNISETVFVGAFTSPQANGVIIIGKDGTASGENSIAIGRESTVSGENSIAIGYQTSVAIDDEVYIGNSAMTSIGGVVNWTSTSDGRFKTNVEENVVGLDFINRLRPVTYHFDGRKVMKHIGKAVPSDLDTAFLQKEKIRYTGFIAQEVEQAAKDVNFDFSGVDAPTDNPVDYYGLRYAEFVVPLVKAKQELAQIIEGQEQTLANLQAEYLAYQKELKEIMLRIEMLEKQKASYCY